MRLLVVALLVVLLAAGCVSQSVTNSPAVRVNLTAADGTVLAADWSPVNGTRAVIMIPMLGHDRSDWAAFSRNLTAANWSTLAVDLRGHGDSEGDYRNFSEGDFSRMQQDVDAARQFVLLRGKKEIVMVGTSIGANLAIMGSVTDPRIKGVVAISPGLDYHSLRPEVPAGALKAPLLLIAAEDDAYSADSARTLEGMAGNGTLVIYPSGGHGMFLFNDNPDVPRAVMDWLNSTVVS